MKNSVLVEHSREILLALAVVGAFAATISAGTATNEIDRVIPVIRFEEVKWETVIDDLAQQAGMNYVFDPKTGWTPIWEPDGKIQLNVTINWTNLTARQALTGLLAYYHLHLSDIVGTTVAKITLTNQVARSVDREWLRSGTNLVIPLVEFELVPLDAAIKQLAAHANLNVVLDLKPTDSSPTRGKPVFKVPTLRLRWRNISARQAIAALCENYGLDLARETSTGSIRISRRMPVEIKENSPEETKTKTQDK